MGPPRLEKLLVSSSGARAVRIIDGAGSRVPEHAHDWPLISIFVMGRYVNNTALGPLSVGSPSVVFYRAREAHANVIADDGLEQIDIEFDPSWLRLDEDGAPPVRRWVGGATAQAAGELARLWGRGAPDVELAVRTRAFLDRAFMASEPRRPAWVEAVQARLGGEVPVTTRELAEELALHPAWMAQAYRAAVGEGLRDTVRRRRVERAVGMLRGTDAPASAIAIDAGFCDQSHMIRAFGHVLGRSPGAVRHDFAAR